MSDEHSAGVSAAQVRERIEALAPPGLAESWDNVGWQIGYDGAAVHGILASLDVDLDVIDEAVRNGCDLIVAHHPIIFATLRSIDPSRYQGRLLRRLLCDGISVFAAHTNLDAVRDGVNGALADRLALTPDRPLVPVGEGRGDWGFGAICEREQVTTDEIVARVRAALGAPRPRVALAADAPSLHRRVALLGGSGGSMIADAVRAGCSLFVTGELKYHDAQDATRAGLTVIEVGHYYSERPVVDRLVEWLAPLGVPVHPSTRVTSPYDLEWMEQL